MRQANKGLFMCIYRLAKRKKYYESENGKTICEEKDEFFKTNKKTNTHTCYITRCVCAFVLEFRDSVLLFNAGRFSGTYRKMFVLCFHTECEKSF